ncbi:E3 ubiquitin-protein ligase RNF181-like [Prunus yedoensis var. nudiflora]|uniref:E3 ubiquitin-protein ligase RNF181-like n=1 Tax=Prunus yedoensis var. nudiflora TaxID=2094558 RepID=A0A314ZCQ1_PRUYE|nr:E3 ubiquitin-protein ligase RNF181-like [Prunus yedoensis var. nudiflora]
METIYQYSISQVEQQNQVLPTTHLLACDCFIFHLDFTHQLKLCFPQDLNIPLNSIQESFFVPFDVFFSHTQETIQTVLSGSGVSMDFVHVLLPEVHSFAMEVAQEPANAGPRIVPLVLAVLAVTPFDDRDQIERAIMESGQVFNPVPAAKSSIAGLKKVKIDNLSVTKECSICLEEFSAGLELPHLVVHTAYWLCIFKNKFDGLITFEAYKPIKTIMEIGASYYEYLTERKKHHVPKFAHQMRKGMFRTDQEVLVKLKALGAL